jgi:hypothetical protein
MKEQFNSYLVLLKSLSGAFYWVGNTGYCFPGVHHLFLSIRHGFTLSHDM